MKRSQWQRTTAMVVAIASVAVLALLGLRSYWRGGSADGLNDPFVAHDVATGQEEETPMVVTATMRVRRGSEMVEVFDVGQIVVGEGLSIITRDEYDEDGQVSVREVHYRKGPRLLKVTSLGTSDVVMQEGEDIRATPPDLIAQAIEKWHHGVDLNILHLIDYKYPVVSLATVDSLVSSEVVTEAGDTSFLGYQARDLRLEVDPLIYGTHGARVLVDTETGLKLRIESLDQNGDASGIYEVHGVSDSSVSTEEVETMASVPLAVDTDNLATNFVESHSFDPDHAATIQLPGATHLLMPHSEPISGTFIVRSSVVITGRMEIDLELHNEQMGDTSDRRYWWVTQELRDETSRALVVQGPESQLGLPINIPEIWPPLWQSDDLVSEVGGIYAQRTLGAFDDDTVYQIYNLRPIGDRLNEMTSLIPGGSVITWIEGEDTRVVLVGQDMGASATVALAEAFRDVSQ